SGNYYTYLGQTVWTAGPALAAQRVQFAHDRDLQHIIIWELGQDLDPTNANSLLRTAFLKNETLAGDFYGDHDSDYADFDLWRSTAGRTTDLSVDRNGNGIVDAGDYVVWLAHAVISGAGAVLNGTVPESCTFLSVVSLLVFAIFRRPSRLG